MGVYERKRRPTIDRFLAMVDTCDNPTDRCWLWTGSRNAKGYGNFWGGDRYENGRTKTVLAHRWSYEYAIGPIPDGLNVLHRCDTPACVRPSHLFVGSQSDNMLDMFAKGRGNAARGSNHPRAKLTESDVAEVRAQYARGATKASLSRRFGVHERQIGRIVDGASWVHPLDPPEIACSPARA